MHRPRYRQMLAPRDGDGAVVVPACELSPSSQDYWELRIASIFIIFVGSAVGALLPIVLARSARMRVPKLCFFVAKYFGTGVILATAWMHLLSPASDNLRDECLADILPDYDWAMAIGLMTVMVMFLLEIVVSRFDFGFGSAHGHSHAETHDDPEAKASPHHHHHPSNPPPKPNPKTHPPLPDPSLHQRRQLFLPARIPILPNDVSYPGGTDHLGHNREHTEGDAHSTYAAQITALFILEFGVIFHSVFIGLTLAVTDNFIVLFIVLVFHQTFEGLGLGARLAMARWPERGGGGRRMRWVGCMR
ncbi:low-affinity Zn(2+) transporter zrt2 [Collariella sp. IMI 366227]|nr:low-affinity Zn(2+) transporter zrt2 [Collariella sp. IMI 366227]